EARERSRSRGDTPFRALDLFCKRRIDRDVVLTGEFEKAPGEVGIIGGERTLDLPGGNGGIEGARDRVVGERYRIGLGGKQGLRLEGAGCNEERSARRGDRENQRHCYPLWCHGAPPALPILSRVMASARYQARKSAVTGIARCRGRFEKVFACLRAKTDSASH